MIQKPTLSLADDVLRVSALDALPSDAPGWCRLVEELLAREHAFLAHDVAARALEAYPDNDELSLLVVLALLHCRSTGPARKAFQRIRSRLVEPLALETRERLAELRRLLWVQQGLDEDLVAALGHHLVLAEAGRPSEHLFHAAVISRRLGKHEEGAALATELERRARVHEQDDDPTVRFRSHLLQGHAALLQGRTDRALDAYRRAGGSWTGPYERLVAARNNLESLQSAGVSVPDEAFRLLPAPTVVLFGGQKVDRPDAPTGLLPPEKLPALYAELTRRLDELDARIGYAIPSAGADILFLEAMAARGAETHVILPSAMDDFVAAHVAPAGAEWVARFERAMEQARSVLHTTTERYLGHTSLLRFANDVTLGTAWLRARLLRTEPVLLAARSRRAVATPGTAADFVSRWPDPASLHLVELDDLPPRVTLPTPVSDDPPPPPTVLPEREVRAMLFADIVGYSLLGEEHHPAWLRFLQAVAQRLPETAELVEAWGDALYVVHPSAREILRTAFALRDAIRELDAVSFGLPQPLRVRIGLHAGPVFRGVHPVTGRPIVSGRQVNRAARIEPVTLPDQVYASLELVALLAAEELTARQAALERGEPHERPWRAEYLGVVDLPKGHGRQSIYHLVPLSELAVRG